MKALKIECSHCNSQSDGETQTQETPHDDGRYENNDELCHDDGIVNNPYTNEDVVDTPT